MPEEEFPPFGGPPLGFETNPGKVQPFADKIPSPNAERSVAEQINSLMARLRDIERRFADVQDLFKFHEEESRKNFNRVWARLKDYDNKLTSLSHTVAELEHQTHLVINELRLTAKKEDFEVMKRFIEYIKPVKFVTVDQVERIVKDIMEQEQQRIEPQFSN